MENDKPKNHLKEMHLENDGTDRMDGKCKWKGKSCLYGCD